MDCADKCVNEQVSAGDVKWFKCFVFSYSVINELDGLKRDFHVDKYNDLQHAQYVLENARCV